MIPKIPVPCGKCPYCLQRRANSWIFRCQQHAKKSDTVLFVTLTYSPQHVPKTKKNLLTLDKKGLQKFHKRVRHYSKKRGNLKKVSYYAVGEYGTSTNRPHYHGIYFNADPLDIAAAWPYGIIDVQTVKDGAYAYVAKYINKGKTVPRFDGDDRLPEFQLFSQGLGADYLSEDVIKWHQADLSRSYVTIEGFKKALPKYFRNKIFTDEQKNKQIEFAQQRANEQYEQQYEEFKEGRSFNETFEQFRYERKKQALEAFKERLKERNKI